ncbi:MAG: P-II family nitrogen regulator [Candidatus Nealsonbacteria bacterium]|nr:P-II family nitrogen regulator [Candidatus Nealsonbacteria bacterium]
MKLILAFIRPDRVETVKAALAEVGISRMTVMNCQGFGREVDRTQRHRGHEPPADLHRKVQLQVAVREEAVERTIDAIVRGGRTDGNGEVGDGKIFVLPLEQCIRIRTGKRGDEAI